MDKLSNAMNMRKEDYYISKYFISSWNLKLKIRAITYHSSANKWHISQQKQISQKSKK